MTLLILTILLFIAYGILILYFRQAWIQVPEYYASGDPGLLKTSIIIAARNEEENIGTLLDSLMKQNYPQQLTEIIVADDHSTDKTADIVKQFPAVKLVPLQNEILNSYKKKAIETAIAEAGGELIITTDADCIVGPDWLKTIVSFSEKSGSLFIAAPVSFTGYRSGSRLLYYFQVLDFLVLQGITGGAVHKRFLSMCNGANLAYEKKVFTEVNGFKGIDHIASGDDMLLMHKIKTLYPEKVNYLKSREAIVYTHAAGSWKEFLDQRIRWASKAGKYEDKKIFWVLLLVYLFNLSLFILFAAGFIHYYYWFYLLYFWIAKTIIEFPFVNTVAAFFNRRPLMKYFFFFQPLHILYTIVAGWLGQFTGYEWKGRKVK